MFAYEKIRFPRQAVKVKSKLKFLVTEVNEDGPVKSQETMFYVIPAPHQVRDKLHPESSIFK